MHENCYRIGYKNPSQKFIYYILGNGDTVVETFMVIRTARNKLKKIRESNPDDIYELRKVDNNEEGRAYLKQIGESNGRESEATRHGATGG